jgi:hypothetical protein
MNLIGGSEFNDQDFLFFAQKLKEFTYNTYLEVILNDDDDKEYKERVKTKLEEYKKHVKDELLDSYDKKSKFNDLNKMVVEAANDRDYQRVAHAGYDETYDFTGLTEKVLKKIGINYVLYPDELDSIRSVLESSDSSSSSSSNSPVSSRAGKKMKNKSKKKKITKSKKRKRRSKKTKKR